MTRTFVVPRCVAAAVLAACFAGPSAAQTDRWAEARERMVQEHVVGSGVSHSGVIDAIRNTRRHLFLPPAQRRLAYFDMALPIGGGQTISPPFIVALMTQELDPQPEDRVLEIGTGSGYQAAVLSPLVAEVYSIEIVESLGRRAARTLRRQGYENVHTRIGDGFLGWPEKAPFDKIIVTCSPEQIPAPLVEQLREGGRMVIPLGQRYQQTLYRMKKVDGKMDQETIEPTFFVPMTGEAEQLRAIKDETGRPTLVNGGFEKADEEQGPDGWYYVRQAKAVDDPQAPEGKLLLQLRNSTPGRGAQVLQALAMDGRHVREIELSAWVRAQDVRAGQSDSQVPRIELNFFDQRRASAGSRTLGPWRGTFEGKLQQAKVRVPGRTRLAVLVVGMFGGVGEISFDQLNIRVTEKVNNGGANKHEGSEDE